MFNCVLYRYNYVLYTFLSNLLNTSVCYVDMHNIGYIELFCAANLTAMD